VSRHSITGHADRHYHKRIAANIVGGIGGIVKPRAPEPEVPYVNEAHLAELQARVKHLETAIRAKLEADRAGSG
jgi:hypothetical protein